MTRTVNRAVSQKPIQESDILPSLNREVVPVVGETRKAVNSILSSQAQAQYVHELRSKSSVPATTGIAYTDCDTAHTSDIVRGWFDASLYPEDPHESLERKVRLEIVVEHVYSSGTSASFVLYNNTEGEQVTGTEYTTQVTDAVERYLSDPLTIGSEEGNVRESLCEYVVQGKRTGGTSSDKAACYSARFLVRYE